MSTERIEGRIPISEATRGFVDLMGATVVEASADRVVLSLEVDERHHQPAGVLHGGVHCALVETAASIGAHLWDGGPVVGVSNHTDFIRSFRGGRLISTGTPIHRGRSQQLWLVEISDDGGKLIARGEVRLQNLNAL
ncbi:PaaI family thioesterase [Sporichthya polymorpha]|uniref:PaaI family thioesterase n=1 Tax=Sporichthya polymorpha TaxID=35751 RepID=UPI000366CA02|nr:PaaI family thioesterase [Sporichthya polymorpha]